MGAHHEDVTRSNPEEIAEGDGGDQHQVQQQQGGGDKPVNIACPVDASVHCCAVCDADGRVASPGCLQLPLRLRII